MLEELSDCFWIQAGWDASFTGDWCSAPPILQWNMDAWLVCADRLCVVCFLLVTLPFLLTSYCQEVTGSAMHIFSEAQFNDMWQDAHMIDVIRYLRGAFDLSIPSAWRPFLPTELWSSVCVYFKCVFLWTWCHHLIMSSLMTGWSMTAGLLFHSFVYCLDQIVDGPTLTGSDRTYCVNSESVQCAVWILATLKQSVCHRSCLDYTQASWSGWFTAKSCVIREKSIRIKTLCEISKTAKVKKWPKFCVNGRKYPKYIFTFLDSILLSGSLPDISLNLLFQTRTADIALFAGLEASDAQKTQRAPPLSCLWRSVLSGGCMKYIALGNHQLYTFGF